MSREHLYPNRTPGSFSNSRSNGSASNAIALRERRELLYQEAKAKGVKVTNKDVDSALAEVRKKYKDRKDFDAELRQSGLSLDEYRSILKRNEYIEKLQRQEVGDKAKYPDEALETYYNANKEKFMRPESFRVRHIILKVPAMANDTDKKEIRDRAEDLLKRSTQERISVNLPPITRRMTTGSRAVTSDGCTGEGSNLRWKRQRSG